MPTSLRALFSGVVRVCYHVRRAPPCRLRAKKQRKSRAALASSRSNREPREYKAANPLNVIPKVRGITGGVSPTKGAVFSERLGSRALVKGRQTVVFYCMLT